MSETTDRLREAGDALRSRGSEFGDALADWLLAEATLRDALGPMTELLGLAYEMDGGTKASLTLNRRDDGSILFDADTSDQALRVANLALTPPIPFLSTAQEEDA